MWTRASDLDRMFDTMDLFRSKMNRILPDIERLYEGDLTWGAINGSPRMNLYDNGDEFQIVAEVPGLSKDDLHVKTQGNYLELSATNRADIPEGYKAHRVERGTTTFTRSFTLPADVDADKVRAVLKDGLLHLSLPKSETAKPKQISIE